MKLKEIGLPPESFVSIGAGSAYFFIGKLGEFFEIASAGEYDDKFRKSSEEKLKQSRIKVKQIIDGLRNDRDNLSLAEKLGNAWMYYHKALDACVNYTEVLDREVLDIYERTCDPGVGIKIEGDEAGNLWLYSERVDKRTGFRG